MINEPTLPSTLSASPMTSSVEQLKAHFIHLYMPMGSVVNAMSGYAEVTAHIKEQYDKLLAVTSSAIDLLQCLQSESELPSDWLAQREALVTEACKVIEYAWKMNVHKEEASSPSSVMRHKLETLTLTCSQEQHQTSLLSWFNGKKIVYTLLEKNEILVSLPEGTVQEEWAHFPNSKQYCVRLPDGDIFYYTQTFTNAFL